jgi:DNA-binding NarL/FixJ family response regulator
VIRVVLADDHPVITDGLTLMLKDYDDVSVVARASTAVEALAAVARERPDVLVLDLELPDRSGLEVLDELHGISDGPRTVIFSAYGGSTRVSEALERGAAAYVLKGTPSEELVRAIRTVASGQSYLSPSLSGDLINALREPARERLTGREVQILRLMASGLANKEIARDLGITERTVKFHVSEILARLGASNRAHAVSVARERGLL